MDGLRKEIPFEVVKSAPAPKVIEAPKAPEAGKGGAE